MNAKQRTPKWLTRNLFAISWVSLLQDAASEMLYPIMPMFLNATLGAPAAIIGAIEGAAEGAMAFTKLISGWLNRFMPRKVMVFVGYSGAAIGKLLIALAGAWPMVLLGKLVDRLGKGVRSAARDAILVQGVDAAERGKVIGFHRTADTTGAVIGPILALALLSIFDGNIRPILWIAVIPAALSVFAVLFIKDQDPATRISKSVIKAGKQVSAVGKLDRKVSSLIWVLAIFALANFPDALVLLHLGQEGFSITEVVSLYLLFNISYAALSFPAGALADRFSPKTIYALGLICFSVAYGGFALTNDRSLAYLFVIIYGGFAAANDVVGKSWVSKLANDDQQLKVQARLQGLSGFSLLAAGLWAGLLWNLDGGFGIVPLLISAVVGLASAAFIGFSKFGRN